MDCGSSPFTMGMPPKGSFFGSKRHLVSEIRSWLDWTLCDELWTIWPWIPWLLYSMPVSICCINVLWFCTWYTILSIGCLLHSIWKVSLIRFLDCIMENFLLCGLNGSVTIIQLRSHHRLRGAHVPFKFQKWKYSFIKEFFKNLNKKFKSMFW